MQGQQCRYLKKRERTYQACTHGVVQKQQHCEESSEYQMKRHSHFNSLPPLSGSGRQNQNSRMHALWRRQVFYADWDIGSHTMVGQGKVFGLPLNWQWPTYFFIPFWMQPWLSSKNEAGWETFDAVWLEVPRLEHWGCGGGGTLNTELREGVLTLGLWFPSRTILPPTALPVHAAFCTGVVTEVSSRSSHLLPSLRCYSDGSTQACTSLIWILNGPG